jgi:hypothetical protein
VCHTVPTGVAGLEKKMKIQTLLLSLAALSVYAASAQVNIPILNPLFNEDQLSCTAGELACWVPGATGWLTGPQTGPEKVSTAQYPSAPAGGFYVMAVGYTNTTGSMIQTLADTVEANTTYVLKISLGARADVPFTGYIANPAQLGKPLQILLKSLGTGQVNVASVSLTGTAE